MGSIFAAQNCMCKPLISHSRGFVGRPCTGNPLLVLVPSRDSNQRHNRCGGHTKVPARLWHHFPSSDKTCRSLPTYLRRPKPRQVEHCFPIELIISLVLSNLPRGRVAFRLGLPACWRYLPPTQSRPDASGAIVEILDGQRHVERRQWKARPDNS